MPEQTDHLVLLVVILAGMVRGITGFGGAMFMAPTLSLLISPVAAVIYALTLEAAAAVAMLPMVWRLIEFGPLAKVMLPAALFIPLGGWALVSLDPGLIGNMLALTVVAFSLLMLFGFRFREEPHLAVAVAAGSRSGVLFGATSMGGPPVILYFLSGPSRHDVIRADLMLYISALSVLALIVPWQAGQISGDTARQAALLVVPYLAGTWCGARFFSMLDDKMFRKITLLLMFSVSGAALLF